MKIVREILSFIKYFLFKKNAIIETGYYFSKFSSISISDGSIREDINIEGKIKLFGRLISQNRGKIVIGYNVQIGPDSIIGAVNFVEIGEGTVISNNVIVMDNNNHPINPNDRILMQSSEIGSELRKWKYSVSQPIYIGKNVWIGQFARINKGVKIGDNSIVAAMSVVTKDVPPNSIIAGNPGKIVKTEIDKLPKIFQ